MGATYEIWVCDDAGRRLYLVDEYFHFSYSRSTRGFGTAEIGIPFDKYVKGLPSIFQPDWRLDIWRSPQEGIPSRREGSYLLRRFDISQSTGNNMRKIILYGRSPLDILRRQCWETDAAQTAPIDDMMKAIVRGMFTGTASSTSTAPATLSGGVYTYTGEFTCDADFSQGPTVTYSFYLRNVLDVLQDLFRESLSLNLVDASNKKIYFDVVEDNSAGLSGGFGYRFRTFPSLRGGDRTLGVVFSTDNGNLIDPNYHQDHGETSTGIYLYNQEGLLASAISADSTLSRWNFIKKCQTTSITSSSSGLSDAYAELGKKSYSDIMNVTLISSPGSNEQPRSLYPIEWDLGDLLPVKFCGKVINVEVAIIYVSCGEDGSENILGKTIVGAA